MPANAANPATGTAQAPASPPAQMPLNINCEEKKNDPRPDKKWDDCMVEQLCAMVKAYNESPHPKKRVSPSPSHPSSKFPDMTPAQKQAQNAAFKEYQAGIATFATEFEKLVAEKGKDHPDVVSKFHAKCQHQKWSEAGGPIPVPRSKNKLAMNPDHTHPAGLGGPYIGSAGVKNLKWADLRVNVTVGPAMDSHDPATHPGGIKADKTCHCG